MAIAPQARRQGVATALLAAGEARALERGEDVIWLHVEPSNVPAIALYERGGFERQPDTGPAQGFARALELQESAYLYRKDLHSGGGDE